MCVITEEAHTAYEEVLRIALPAARLAGVDVRQAMISIQYAWNVCRAAVFVAVRDGKVVAFIPFVNTTFRNTWAARLHPRIEVGAAITAPSGPDKIPIMDPSAWWCNAGILCTGAAKPPAPVWSNTYMASTLDMISRAAARDRTLRCAFIFNKRDHPLDRKPQMGVEVQHPYGFLYYPDSPPPVQDPELQWKHGVMGGMLRFVSFYGGDTFRDLLVPTTDDWEVVSTAASASAVPGFEGRQGLLDAVKRTPWKMRASKAVFRGGSTGWGHTPVTNTRLALALRARMDDPEKEWMDVEITGRNARHKVVPGGEVQSSVHPGVKSWWWLVKGRAAWMDASKQAGFKYQLYVDGHAGASRLGGMCLSGGVLIMVQNIMRDAMEVGDTWLHEALRPHTWRWTRANHQAGPPPRTLVLSVAVHDVLPCVQWLSAHDDEARSIAAQLNVWAQSHVTEDAVLEKWHRALTACMS